MRHKAYPQTRQGYMSLQCSYFLPNQTSSQLTDLRMTSTGQINTFPDTIIITFFLGFVKSFFVKIYLVCILHKKAAEILFKSEQRSIKLA